jgi:hypothetical protein
MGTIVGEDFPEEILSPARELGKKLVRSWKEKVVITEAEEVRKSFEDRVKHLMLYRDNALIVGFGKFSLRRKAQGKGKILPPEGMFLLKVGRWFNSGAPRF